MVKYLFVFSLLMVIACKKASPSGEINDANPKSQEFDVVELDTADYRMERFKDTTYYFSAINASIDGKNIAFDANRYINVSAKAKFNLGFLQYTTDDEVAYPLNFNEMTQWVNLEVEDGEIKIPDFYDNSENPKLFELLGFQNILELSGSVLKNNFEAIKQESLGSQRGYFERILQDKEIKKCCPEYIEQAKSFFKKPISSFKTIDDLSLELYYSVIIIEIKAKTKSKDISISKVIISK
ncbi:MAG: hypothetical protein EOO46_10670 [Flavobacterium sp.]|nr:MAG: hypothetical protein EOO46_10670 [Flavobacterium sp.]